MRYSVEKGTFPRVTHPSATPRYRGVRLACVKPAASVRSEPGSNSHVENSIIGYNHVRNRRELHTCSPKPILANEPENQCNFS